MKTPVVVNESTTMAVPGDVQVFAIISDLEMHLEPWYVDESHFIFDSEGMQLEITPNGHNVRLSPKRPKIFRPEIARMYFAEALKNNGGVSSNFIDTATLSQLAAASAKLATK